MNRTDDLGLYKSALSVWLRGSDLNQRPSSSVCDLPRGDVGRSGFSQLGSASRPGGELVQLFDTMLCKESRFQGLWGTAPSFVFDLTVRLNHKTGAWQRDFTQSRLSQWATSTMRANDIDCRPCVSSRKCLCSFLDKLHKAGRGRGAIAWLMRYQAGKESAPTYISTTSSVATSFFLLLKFAIHATTLSICPRADSGRAPTCRCFVVSCVASLARAVVLTIDERTIRRLKLHSEAQCFNTRGRSQRQAGLYQR